MQPFTVLESRAIPLDRPNVDTDQIIPKQFLKSVLRSGLGCGLFFDWRYRPDGSLDTGFILNQPAMQGAQILLADENFGCGSSREHAPWALADFGIRAIIAPSFADIFFNNCCKNGMLPLTLSRSLVREWLTRAAEPAGLTLRVDLTTQSVTDDSGRSHRFEIDSFRKQCLLEGLDDIALTLQHEGDISAYEQRRGFF